MNSAMNVIVDVEGFMNEKNQFIPKEIAILSKEHVMILLLMPPYPYYKLTKKERSTVTWIERFREFYWNEGFIPFNQYKYILKEKDFF